MYFHLKKSKIYKAVAFSKLLSPFALKLWGRFCLIVGLVAFSLYMLLSDIFSLQYVIEDTLGVNLLVLENSTLLGLSLMFIPIGLSVKFIEIFFASYLKHPKIQNKENFADFLDFDSAIIFDNTISISTNRKEKNVSTTSLLLALIAHKSASNILLRIGLEPEQLKKQLSKDLRFKWPIFSSFASFLNATKFSEELTNLLVDTDDIRRKHGHERIEITDLMTSLFDFNPTFKQLVIEQSLDKNDLNQLSIWYEKDRKFLENRAKFWRKDNLLRLSPIGVSWVYGYPFNLRRFTVDITRPFIEKTSEIHIVGRDKTMDHVEQILAKTKGANLLLVGEKGIGKRTIILGLAQKISSGKTLLPLNYKRIFEFNIPLITASSKYESDIQNTLTALLAEATSIGNAIIFIDGLEGFIGALGGIGRSDISGVLLPFLESTNVQVIATTDPVSFHKYIETNSSILNVFNKIDIPELNLNDVARIVEDAALVSEKEYKVFLTYSAIKMIVEDADKYIQIIPFPQKAINLLDEVVSFVMSGKKRLIFAQDVHDVITQKTGIPVGDITGHEREKLINLEKEMHKEIIGQDKAVKVVAQTMRRLRSGLSRRGKPAGVFLFAGPTGVGKTLTAKMLAKTYFGSPDKMIRFDMSEYQNPESLARLLGSIRLNEPGQLVSAVRDNPFSVLLLDEIEKAHKNILLIFLQIFDEGRVTDVFGRKVSFEQNIIIATSNAGSELIRDMVKEGLDPSLQKEKFIDILIKQGNFRPEFLNRFDEIVPFHPLSREHIRKIAEILIKNLVNRLRDNGYYFNPTPEVLDYIVQVGFDPQFGARPMNRAIQDKLENVIARKILEKTIVKGTEFSLSLEEIK